MKRLAVIVLVLLAADTGCAHQSGPAASPTAASADWAGHVAGRCQGDVISGQVPFPPLAHDRCRPPLMEPSSPPAEALVLYAEACQLLLDQKSYEAINVLEQAIELDPNSFDLYYSLGRAQLLRLRRPNEKAFDAFEHAVAIEPDNLEVQLLLGREYLVIDKNDLALAHLRAAQQTPGYHHDESRAAAVDLFLARALQQEGYDRAALECYVSLPCTACKIQATSCGPVRMSGSSSKSRS